MTNKQTEEREHQHKYKFVQLCECGQVGVDKEEPEDMNIVKIDIRKFTKAISKSVNWNDVQILNLLDQAIISEEAKSFKCMYCGIIQGSHEVNLEPEIEEHAKLPETIFRTADKIYIDDIERPVLLRLVEIWKKIDEIIDYLYKLEKKGR